MAQQLKVLAALAEDQSTLWFTNIYSSSSRGSDALFCSPQQQAHLQCTCKFVCKTLIHKMDIS